MKTEDFGDVIFNFKDDFSIGSYPQISGGSGSAGGCGGSGGCGGGGGCNGGSGGGNNAAANPPDYEKDK